MLIKLKLPERKEHRPSCVALRQLQMCDCGIQYWNDYRDQVESLNPEMEIDIEAFAKEMFEICTFPEPTPWEGLDQRQKDRWKANSMVLKANAHVWLKEVEKGK